MEYWSKRKVKPPFTSTEIQWTPNKSFSKSAQCLRSSGGLVLPIRFDRRREGTSQYNNILTKLKTEEVQLLVSPPTRATGNRMQERVFSFDELAGKIQLTQLCEQAYFQHLVAAWKRYTFRPNGEDGWGSALFYAENTRFLDIKCPKAQALAAIPEGTIFGPVHDRYGIEVAIPSIPIHIRETERFVNEVHDHKEELRSSNELIAHRKLVLVLSAICLKEHPCTHKEPFLQIRGGRSFMRTHQMEDIWQLQYPRWLQKYCVIMTQMKDKPMVQDIGIQLGQYWWKRLHKKKHEILMMGIGQC